MDITNPLLVIVGIVIVFHEAYYLAINGRDRTASGFHSAWPWLPANLIRAATFLIFFLETCFGVGGFLASPLVILYCLSHPWRISNHLLLCALLVCIETLQNVPIEGLKYDSREVARVVLGVTFIIAGFFKLNTEFFDPRSSCATRFLNSVAPSRYVNWLSKLKILPLLIVLGEILAGVVIVHGGYVVYGYLGILVLAYCFAVTGNAHFSMLVCLLVWWSARLPIPAQLAPVSWAIVIVCSGLAFNFRVDRFRYTTGARCCHGFVGLVISITLLQIVATGARTTTGLEIPAWFAIVFLIMNSALAFFGKSEFSLAMFSNYRADTGNHWLLPSTAVLLPDYVRIERVEGIDALIRHRSYTIRKIGCILAARERYTYNPEFIRSVLRLLQKVGLYSVGVLISERGKRRQLTPKDWEKIGSPKWFSMRNRGPMFRSEPNIEPYMG